MNARKYFQEHGFIYGISEGIFPGDPHRNYLVFFDDWDMAEQFAKPCPLLNETHRLVCANVAYRWQKQYVG